MKLELPVYNRVDNVISRTERRVIGKFRKRNPYPALDDRKSNAISCPLACAEWNLPLRRKRRSSLA